MYKKILLSLFVFSFFAIGIKVQAVTSDSCKISSFTVDGSDSTIVSISEGALLEWTTSGCSSVLIYPLSSDSAFPLSGSQQLYHPQTRDYVLTAYGLNGSSVSKSVHVTTTTVASPQLAILSPNSGFEAIEYRQKVEIRWTTTNIVGAMFNVYVSDGVHKGQVINTANTGSVIYTLGDNLIPGSNYKAYIVMDTTESYPLTDSSDKPFTIKPAVSTIPSITVTSPKGTDIYEEGDIVRVKWNTSNLPADYKITLFFNYQDELKDQYKKTILITEDEDKGYYDYKLPLFSQYKTANYPLPGKNYEFTAFVNLDSNTHGSLAVDSSAHGYNDNFFTINRVASSTSKITVLSPNGGEIYKPGEKITVKWLSENISNDTLINMDLLMYPPNGAYSLARGIKNDGIEIVTLPTEYYWNNSNEADMQFEKIYKVYLYTGTTTLDLKDLSDNTFTIRKTPLEDDGSCLPGYIYDPITGTKCPTSTINNCRSGQNYDPITGLLCPQQGINWGMLQRVLRRGARGDDVALIQTYLGITADGAFGPATEQKIMQWQALNGLTPDGIFGPQSRLKASLGI